jgi:3-oxoadipate enol-lactonase
MSTCHLDVPGGRLLVVDEGTGPPILLLHAAVADLRAWDAMVEPLVAAGYRVIRFDGRNFGGSTGDDVAFSYRADVLAVLDSLGLARAALVGNSRGGKTAVDTAIESPERVVAVVGVGAGSVVSRAFRSPRNCRSSRRTRPSTRPSRSTPMR